MTPSSPTYAAWQKLPDNALGHALFSVGMCLRVPYFGSVLPRVVEMRPGRCEVRAPKWWGVRNHLGTFHAIAACNLAEAAMGMLSEATVPSTHRWIPKSMTVDYLAKANGPLRAIAELTELPDFGAITAGTDVVVPVRILDRRGAEVVHADITTWVTPR
ncbi:hotdog fold domain-containing protein [Rhodococcus koreensis]|uniref:hotdog fold domain-containing protein n=1 Tax=Rhodococcus sp. T2V TaxID=3034164 RepID=UPI0023E1AB21|nr:hotdog fold domain-containing protein [Rhodococcus sp. T2V]MDF3303921.1 hotdog fold domain-containing protein [Rhodococcus sp. T2V]